MTDQLLTDLRTLREWMSEPHHIVTQPWSLFETPDGTQVLKRVDPTKCRACMIGATRLVANDFRLSAISEMYCREEAMQQAMRGPALVLLREAEAPPAYAKRLLDDEFDWTTDLLTWTIEAGVYLQVVDAAIAEVEAKQPRAPAVA